MTVLTVLPFSAACLCLCLCASVSVTFAAFFILPIAACAPAGFPFSKAKDKTARGDILRDAKAFGDALGGMQDRHITVIYNPFGGGGRAKGYVSKMIIPVLQLDKLRFTIVPTRCVEGWY